MVIDESGDMYSAILLHHMSVLVGHESTRIAGIALSNQFHLQKKGHTV